MIHKPETIHNWGPHQGFLPLSILSKIPPHFAERKNQARGYNFDVLLWGPKLDPNFSVNLVGYTCILLRMSTLQFFSIKESRTKTWLERLGVKARLPRPQLILVLSLVPHLVPQVRPQVISEHRVRRKAWAPPGVAPLSSPRAPKIICFCSGVFLCIHLTWEMNECNSDFCFLERCGQGPRKNERKISSSIC